MKALGTMIAALLLLTACGTKPDRPPLDVLVPDPAAVDADLALSDVDWEGWTPVYGALRPATQQAAGEVRARIEARNASRWTGHELGSGAEISYAPSHVRLSWGYLALHYDPREDLGDGTSTVCVASGCTELAPGDEAEPATEDLLQEDAPGAVTLLASQLDWQENLDDAMDEGVTRLATVDTPAGPWDCFVHGRTARALDALVGSSVEAAPTDGPVETFVSLCVDRRGLVVLDGTSGSVLARYDEWRGGVDADAATPVAADPLPEPPAVDPTGAYEDVRWSQWQGVYAAVRRATKADLSRLRDRVAALNETSWTGVLDGYGATVSVSPDHARADMGFAEWHFDSLVGPFDTPYVLCLDEEEACVRVGPDADTGDSPHVFNNDLDSMTFTWLVALVGQRESVADAAEHQPLLLATVESPVGPLDCLVAGDDPTAIEGVVLDGEDAPEEASAPVCVDQRGLVQQVGAGGMFGMRMPYVSWHPGVEAGFDTVPFRVQDYDEG